MRRQYRLIWISVVCTMPRLYSKCRPSYNIPRRLCKSQINSHHLKSKLSVATVMRNLQTSAGCKLVTKSYKWIHWPHDAGTADDEERAACNNKCIMLHIVSNAAWLSTEYPGSRRVRVDCALISYYRFEQRLLFCIVAWVIILFLQPLSKSGSQKKWNGSLFTTNFPDHI